jgi:hypothetical protein
MILCVSCKNWWKVLTTNQRSELWISFILAVIIDGCEIIDAAISLNSDLSIWDYRRLAVLLDSKLNIWNYWRLAILFDSNLKIWDYRRSDFARFKFEHLRLSTLNSFARLKVEHLKLLTLSSFVRLKFEHLRLWTQRFRSTQIWAFEIFNA